MKIHCHPRDGSVCGLAVKDTNWCLKHLGEEIAAGRTSVAQGLAFQREQQKAHDRLVKNILCTWTNLCLRDAEKVIAYAKKLGEEHEAAEQNGPQSRAAKAGK
jgi:hypothetical protein